MSDINIDDMPFEAAYRELEETVEKLESGDLPLEEVIALYKRGVALAKRCQTQLDEAELTIKTVNGTIINFQ